VKLGTGALGNIMKLPRLEQEAVGVSSTLSPIICYNILLEELAEVQPPAPCSPGSKNNASHSVVRQLSVQCPAGGGLVTKTRTGRPASPVSSDVPSTRTTQVARALKSSSFILELEYLKYYKKYNKTCRFLCPIYYFSLNFHPRV